MTEADRRALARPTDPYKVLQVDPEADPEIIQAAYRRLARKYHPDIAPGSEAAARMVAINAAWEVLRDPASRAAHDRSRPDGRHAAGSHASTTRDAPAREGGHRQGPHREAAPDAGPPPGRPSGSVLVFGRYAGWSLGEIARRDLEYIEWLDRMPIGRPYRDEIDAILRRAGRRRAPGADEEPRRGLFRRR
jgi:curved DNA-binding protein CbpA